MCRFIHVRVFFMLSQSSPHRGLDMALPHTMNPPQDPFELSGSPWMGSSEARLALQGHTRLCVALGRLQPGRVASRVGRGRCNPAGQG